MTCQVVHVLQADQLLMVSCHGVDEIQWGMLMCNTCHGMRNLKNAWIGWIGPCTCFLNCEHGTHAGIQIRFVKPVGYMSLVNVMM